MNKIVVAGYHGFENAGDDATLITIINSIRSNDEKAKITVLSWNPKLTEELYKVKATYRFNPFTVLAKIIGCNVLVLGGGTLLQDATSKRSNTYYLGLIRIAKMFGKKVMLYSNGLGPFSEEGKKKTAKVLEKVDLITLRENFAKSLLDEMKVTKPEVVITADPAFTLGSMIDEKDKLTVIERENIPTDKKLVGLSIRSARGEEEYKKIIAKLCDYIIEKYDCNILFIPFQYPKDLKISDEIVDVMKNKAYVVRGKNSVKEIINLISNCYMTISMRLHSLIFSAIANVPSLGIVYDPKVDHYCKLLGAEKLGTNIDLDFDFSSEKVDIIMNNYVNIKDNLKARTDELSASAKDTEALLGKLLKKS